MFRDVNNDSNLIAVNSKKFSAQKSAQLQKSAQICALFLLTPIIFMLFSCFTCDMIKV